MATTGRGTIRRADEPADYKRFAVLEGTVEDWEDAQRESQSPGSFEWWYFDVLLADGVWIVVVFLTKPLDEPMGELQPVVAAKIQLPQENFARGGECTFAKVSFVADKAQCDVRVGPNFCRQQAGSGKYVVEFRRGDIDGTIELEVAAPVAPARIGTGYLLFEQGGSDHYFGWVVPVPHGKATARYAIEGQPYASAGIGYHDHNWGDRPMIGGIHHWYWGRAFVDDFVVIAANVTAQPEYGSVEHTDLVLIEAGKFLALGSQGVSFHASTPNNDPDTQKPVSDITSYTFVDASGSKYVATFARKQTRLAKMIGGAAYHRFVGDFTLEFTRGGTPTRLEKKATWELMWFGSPPEASAFELYTRLLVEPKGF